MVKAPYQDNPAHPDEEYFRKLLDFQRVEPPMTAADVKRVTGVDYVFMQTMFGLDVNGGKAIRKFMVDTGRITG